MKTLLAILVLDVVVLFSATNSSGEFDLSKLSTYEKLETYAKLRTSPTTSVILGGTIGFGTGSFLQGDYLGGAACLSSELVGVGLVASGFGSGTPFTSSGTAASALVLVGSVLFLTSRILQILLPVEYSRKKNDILLEKLGIAVRF
ncbi:MAG: P13 family porin [Spirochaetia bacterium]|nr:P13 family porin [Spirochaetia bacterium]